MPGGLHIKEEGWMSILSRLMGKNNPATIEMVLDHDGDNWIVSNESLTLAAPSLDELDRRLEAALQEDIEREDALHVFMRFNNEVIPMWIRPYMNHYFNRILELPLRYKAA
jgi:hypothetical protein